MSHHELNLMPFIMRHHEPPDATAGSIHPSGLGLCPRVAYWKYQGKLYDLDYNEEDQRRFASGYMIEDYVLRAYIYNGSLIAAGVPVGCSRGGYLVRGKVDAIVKVDDGWAILDVKSVSPWAFTYGDLPYSHHDVQVGAYSICINEMLMMQDSELTRIFGDDGSNWIALIRELSEGKLGRKRPPILHYVARDLSADEAMPVGDGAQAKAFVALDWLAGHFDSMSIPPRPWRSPEDHPFACAKQIQKGYQSKRDGRWTKLPVWVPTCNYFKSCWSVQPDEWNFWSEVIGKGA